ncbi:nicotinate (nicotinamide) nucleotide adenylyltransferase [Sulfurospirillum sp. T05]|uniref:Multifunctional fusion protein n=1 Tax=Sulfurospirillum tamanense TaxID=2813362 RepID=A0ABS2WSW6_9BACT|nr:nicotinate (nicotinamide) nucleotide adenylyltransferase [Sulfurospirillum tamanensis]MBN2964693.1 nicotinate (nicotinamide) nucleotide adenylyltransferase [Sulfurospirillum tamanensis]
MKLAIFGGSFDPPHTGHEAIITAALKHLTPDLLVVVPTWLNPFKTAVSAPANLRLAWVHKAWGHLPHVEICPFEVEQARAVPSIETVKHLCSTYQPSHIFLIIGEDNLASLGTWNSFQELSRLVEFVVATRGGKLKTSLKKLSINVTISSSKLREHLDASKLPKPIVVDVLNYYHTRKPMKERIERIVALLDDKKAENIQVFDMHGKEYFVEQVVIATTLGERHGASLLDELREVLKPLGEEFLHVDPASEWVVVDLGDILVHLMTPAYRARYNLEEFLSDFERQKM